MAIVFYSDELFSLAWAAVQRADEHPPEAIPAIVVCVIGFELALNELIEQMNNPDGSLRSSKQKGPLDKYSQLYLAMTGKRLFKGAGPYQDLALLVAVRNRLVHGSSESWTIRDAAVADHSEEKLLRQLAGKSLIEPLVRDEARILFFELCRLKIAQWAYATVVDMLSLLAENSIEHTLNDHLARLLGVIDKAS